MNTRINISEDELEELESFLLGTLKPDQQKIVEQKIASDEIYASKLNEVKLLITGIRESELKKHLKTLHQKESVIIKRSPVRRMYFRWVAVAAIFVLVITFALGVFKNKNDKLFAKYYQPDVGLMTSMGATDHYNFDVAMIEFKSGKYEDALIKWLDLRKGNENNDTLNYFIGSGYLALDSVNKSVPYFKQVISLENSVFKSEAYWYVGLALLKDGNSKEALEMISHSTHDKKDELIRKLSN